MTLIAIIMASPTSKDRVKDAQTLFTYGFANAALYHDKTTDQSFLVNVKKGTKEQILAIAKQDFSYLDQSKQDLGKIKAKKICRQCFLRLSKKVIPSAVSIIT